MIGEYIYFKVFEIFWGYQNYINNTNDSSRNLKFRELILKSILLIHLIYSIDLKL
jgi:hypothetical protein